MNDKRIIAIMLAFKAIYGNSERLFELMRDDFNRADFGLARARLEFLDDLIKLVEENDNQ